MLLAAAPLALRPDDYLTRFYDLLSQYPSKSTLKVRAILEMNSATPGRRN